MYSVPLYQASPALSIGSQLLDCLLAQRPGMHLKPHKQDNVSQATKAGKSLCIKTGHTIDNNGLHKHYLELFTWHWRDGRRLTIAAKPAYCAEVKRSLMNRKPYLRELTVTIQQPHCALATNPVGLYIRRNDEKVTRKDTVSPWTHVNATRQ